ncbi:lymphatic vessel endothelial hyaluronic receptor 1b [Aulostomus maculatus]
MARLLLFAQFPLLCLAVCWLASDAALLKVSQAHRPAGVFLLIEEGKYTLNFTAARAACLFLNVTMATAAQMEEAVKQGLQTCKFGWIDQQIAVVPRQTADTKCGKGQTGVVKWFAKPHQEFGVFCFNATDLEEALETSTASPQASTPPMVVTQTPTRATPRAGTAPTPAPSTPPKTTQPSKSAAPTSAFILRPRTPPPPPGPSSTGLPLHSTPGSLSYGITSSPTVTTSASSISTHATNYFVSSEPASPAMPSLGVSTALIVLGVLALTLAAAAGALCYYKQTISPSWSQRQMEDMETEMWKQTDSEMDLHHQHGEEEEEEEDGEETDRKYSSDIMLCMHPDMRTNASE